MLKFSFLINSSIQKKKKRKLVNLIIFFEQKFCLNILW